MTARAQDLRAEVDRLTRENEELRRELAAAEDRADVAEGEARTARHELDDIELFALAHVRAQLESIPWTDVSDWTRVMNERAVDAITELLGDR